DAARRIWIYAVPFGVPVAGGSIYLPCRLQAFAQTLPTGLGVQDGADARTSGQRSVIQGAVEGFAYGRPFGHYQVFPAAFHDQDYVGFVYAGQIPEVSILPEKIGAVGTAPLQ